MISLDYASREEISNYYDSVPVSMKAIAAKDGDKVLGIAGIGYFDNQMLAFSKFDDELKKHPKVILKAGKMLAKLIEKSQSTVYAIAADYEESSERFLERIGFEFQRETMQGKVYKWHQH